jgi:Flp pilus assembly protein TadG
METKSQIDPENVPSAGKGLRAFWNGLRGESGGALIELALVVGLLGVPMLLGTAEMGMLAYDSIEVTDAANAGALYGMRSSTFAANTSAITTAAQTEAADFGTRLGVTPSTFYVCSTAVTGTQYTGTNAQTNAQTACTGGSTHALEFVQVLTSVTVTPPILCPGLPNSWTLHGASVMEVEQ